MCAYALNKFEARPLSREARKSFKINPTNSLPLSTERDDNSLASLRGKRVSF